MNCDKHKGFYWTNNYNNKECHKINHQIYSTKNNKNFFPTNTKNWVELKILLSKSETRTYCQMRTSKNIKSFHINSN